MTLQSGKLILKRFDLILFCAVILNIGYTVYWGINRNQLLEKYEAVKDFKKRKIDEIARLDFIFERIAEKQENYCFAYNGEMYCVKYVFKGEWPNVLNKESGLFECSVGRKI